MKCPVCENTQLVMSERSGIEIDYCPQCRGIWLDRGELDKIIERSQREELAQVDRRPEQRNDHQFGNHGAYRKESEHHHRKKSFWNEIFD